MSRIGEYYSDIFFNLRTWSTLFRLSWLCNEDFTSAKQTSSKNEIDQLHFDFYHVITCSKKLYGCKLMCGDYPALLLLCISVTVYHDLQQWVII